MDTGLYVFCFAPADVDVGGPGLCEADALQVVRCADVAAVACAVPLADWTGPAAEERLRDLGWLGPRALRHEAVLEQVMAGAPVLPLRLGCLFSSAALLQGALEQHQAAIRAHLQRVAGHAEWSLKILLDRRACEEALLRADPRHAALPAAAGARYLRERQLRQEAARAVGPRLAQIEAQVLAALDAALPEAARAPLRALPREPVDGHELARHWALLLSPAGATRLEQLVAALDPPGAGVLLQLSGPWPPYNFCPALG